VVATWLAALESAVCEVATLLAALESAVCDAGGALDKAWTDKQSQSHAKAKILLFGPTTTDSLQINPYSSDHRAIRTI
jgi:hypothetical protein